MIAADRKRKAGLGIKMDRAQKVSIEKATAQAKSDVDFNLGNFGPEANEKHTLANPVIGKYDGKDVKLSHALKGTGLGCSPIVTLIIRFIGIKDCIVMLESSKSSFFDN